MSSPLCNHPTSYRIRQGRIKLDLHLAYTYHTKPTYSPGIDRLHTRVRRILKAKPGCRWTGTKASTATANVRAPDTFLCDTGVNSYQKLRISSLLAPTRKPNAALSLRQPRSQAWLPRDNPLDFRGSSVSLRDNQHTCADALVKPTLYSIFRFLVRQMFNSIGTALMSLAKYASGAYEAGRRTWTGLHPGVCNANGGLVALHGLCLNLSAKSVLVGNIFRKRLCWYKVP